MTPTSKLDTLHTLHTRLLQALKQSPPAHNEITSILSDTKEQMSQIVHDASLYSHFLKIFIATTKDMMTDIHVKKKKKNDNNESSSSPVKEKSPPVKEKEKKPHPYFVSIDHCEIRKCVLDVWSRCPLNEVFHEYAGGVLSCCVNVLLVDYEGEFLLDILLVPWMKY
jgi:hypothetical protein